MCAGFKSTALEALKVSDDCSPGVDPLRLSYSRLLEAQTNLFLRIPFLNVLSSGIDHGVGRAFSAAGDSCPALTCTMAQAAVALMSAGGAYP
jgi:hypothetical protein